MSNVDDALRGRTPMGSAQAIGLETLDLNQEVVFEPYVRLVLPLDGYVFWVKASALSQSAVFNSMMLGAGQFNAQAAITVPAPFVCKGSLHYASDSRQTEEANYSANRVVFTAEDPVQNLNEVNSNLLYIATFDGPTPQSSVSPADTTAIRFAFSSRGSFYQQADLWHYIGFAIYPMQSTQIVDDPRTLQTSQLIVSNSLPLWLAYSMFDPDWPVPVARPPVPFYPSFAVPSNQKPPYVAVHVEPQATESVQVMPVLDANTSQFQTARDNVRLTLYGCNNDAAQSLLYSIMQYSFDTEFFGILNMPVVQDEKEGQNEMNTLAQKKRITFLVSYNQYDIRNLARQLITSCTPTIQVGDEVFV